MLPSFSEMADHRNRSSCGSKADKKGNTCRTSRQENWIGSSGRIPSVNKPGAEYHPIGRENCGGVVQCGAIQTIIHCKTTNFFTYLQEF
jgi:hypothetical protein